MMLITGKMEGRGESGLPCPPQGQHHTDILSTAQACASLRQTWEAICLKSERGQQGTTCGFPNQGPASRKLPWREKASPSLCRGRAAPRQQSNRQGPHPSPPPPPPPHPGCCSRRCCPSGAQLRGAEALLPEASAERRMAVL